MTDSAESPTLMTLMPNDVVGILRQGLGELGTYLSQPIGAIDAAIPMAYLDRMLPFAQHLMLMQQAMSKPAEKAEAASTRKN